MGKFQTDEAFRQEWALRVEQARIAPNHSVWRADTVHREAIGHILRLVWKAKILRRLGVTDITLSPNQLLIRVEAGPLLRPIQSLFTWGGGHTLTETWDDERQAYFDQIDGEDKARGLPDTKYRSGRGWRFCFSGAVGPRLRPIVDTQWVSRRFTWGIKTDAGLWCETFEDRWPTTDLYTLKIWPFRDGRS
ncbi:MAG: hypothetical protein ABIY70_14430 [Capsulimonas sp.]